MRVPQSHGCSYYCVFVFFYSLCHWLYSFGAGCWNISPFYTVLYWGRNNSKHHTSEKSSKVGSSDHLTPNLNHSLKNKIANPKHWNFQHLNLVDINWGESKMKISHHLTSRLHDFIPLDEGMKSPNAIICCHLLINDSVLVVLVSHVDDKGLIQVRASGH